MQITDNERKRYLKDISSLLVCSSKERKKFVKDFNNNIDEFIDANPDADIDTIKMEMGTPQEIAEEFMASASPKEIKKRISTVRAIIIGAAIIIIIIMIFFILIFVDAHKASRGHFEETIIDNGTGNIDTYIIDNGVIYDYGEIPDDAIERP